MSDNRHQQSTANTRQPTPNNRLPTTRNQQQPPISILDNQALDNRHLTTNDQQLSKQKTDTPGKQKKQPTTDKKKRTCEKFVILTEIRENRQDIRLFLFSWKINIYNFPVICHKVEADNDRRKTPYISLIHKVAFLDTSLILTTTSRQGHFYLHQSSTDDRPGQSINWFVEYVK